jgi:RNA polymerase sigma-70 factor, ECF subfamily
MASASSQEAAAVFDPLRPALIRAAYRMLGSVADAEDVVQDAFLRWLDVDRDTVGEPAAFLRRIVTRLCLDRLKSVRREREVYVGTWLPEPVVESGEDEPDDVTLPLLMALERLSPLERAAFLLHDVFGLEFDEVAATIGRDTAACRQLASRARAHVRANRPRYAVPKERGLEIAQAFFAASRNGEMERLRALLTADVTAYADGGGKASAHGAPVTGLEAVMQLFARFAAVFAVNKSRLVRYCLINGLPGFITVEGGDILQTTALEIEDGRVVAVYVTRALMSRLDLR